MYQFIDEIDDQPYMRGGFVFKKLMQAYKYLYSEEFEKMNSICDSISMFEKYYMDKVTWMQLMSKDSKAVFTPERLLGVETNTGFITSVEERLYMGYQARVTTTKGFSYFMETLDYYISDDSDETVTFEEYVNKFYDGGISEAKFTR